MFSFGLLFLYAFLRTSGLDYFTYEEAFYEIKEYYGRSGFDMRMETGYVLLNYIMPSYRFLLLFLSAFTCLTYFLLFRKFIPYNYYWLGFVLLALSGDKMFLFQLSGLRNAIAINIMTLSFPYIVERKFMLYLALTFLSFFFHNSVLFFMPLSYFVATPNKFQKRDMYIWSAFFLFFIGVSSTTLIDYISPFINLYFERYTIYTEIAEEKIYERSILLYGFILTVIAMSFILLRRIILSPTDIVVIKLSLLFFISLILGVLNFRMSQYFAPYLLISCFIFLNRSRIPLLKYGYLTVVCLFMCYSLFFVFMENIEMADFDYKTILE
jgi:hypothetical protein